MIEPPDKAVRALAAKAMAQEPWQRWGVASARRYLLAAYPAILDDLEARLLGDEALTACIEESSGEVPTPHRLSCMREGVKAAFTHVRKGGQ